MNIFYRAWCRTYQGVMRMLLPFLPYRTPEIIRNISDIPGVIKEKGLKKPLIVTDGTLFSLGAVQPLFDALDESGLGYGLFKDVVANPTTETVEAALKVYISGGCDCLVAFGGGSPMDTAKAVGARVANPDKCLAKMKGVLKVGKHTPFLVAVPTTCGTGSETTLAAVIVDAATRDKYAMNDFSLIPDVAVLDTQTLKNLPSKIVAYTGLDALTHAVEAYIGRSTTKDTREAALQAVKLIFENLPSAYDGDMAARANMLEASFLAGRAFTKSYVGYVHALAHSLGGKYNYPHGLANAILLPVVLGEYGKKIDKKLAALAAYCGMADGGGQAFLDKLEELEARFDIPKSFDCIVEDDIPELAKHAAKEANPLYPVPVLWDEKKLAEIYRKVMAPEQ